MSTSVYTGLNRNLSAQRLSERTVESEAQSNWNYGGRRGLILNTLLTPTSCWEVSSVLLYERNAKHFMTPITTFF
jgi:hypothetical protein